MLVEQVLTALTLGQSAGGSMAVSAGTKAATNGFNQGLNFSVKADERMEIPGRFVPVRTLMDVINSTKGVPDPRGSSALMHYAKMTKNRITYTLEVLYDKATNTIYHFKYYR